MGAGAGALLSLNALGCAQKSKTGISNFFEVMHTRRSVRKYKKDQPVPEEHVTQILETAKMAPTAGNRQPWKFVVLRDPKQIERLLEETIKLRVQQAQKSQEMNEDEIKEYKTNAAARLEGYFSAPVYIGVLTDSRAKHSVYNSHDGPLAAGYICLAARALGYGTVYLTGSIPPKAFREAAKVPDYYDITCVIPVGVPDAWPETPPKKKLEELVVYESFDAE